MDELAALPRPPGHPPCPSYRPANCTTRSWGSAGTWPLGLGSDSPEQAAELQSSDQSSAQELAQASSQNPRPQHPRPCPYFSQQEDSLHVLLLQNLLLHLLIPIDLLHQQLQLSDELLPQLLVLYVTCEVDPETEKKCFGAVLGRTEAITPASQHLTMKAVKLSKAALNPRGSTTETLAPQ